MPNIAAIIFVGGRASRLKGRDKSAILLNGRTCLEWTLSRLEGAVDTVALSVGQKDRYDHAKSHEIIFDWPSQENGHAVAFAILSSLNWARQLGFDAIVTAPVDTPFLPEDYAQALIAGFDEPKPVVCKTADGLHGLHALWPTTCFDRLKQAITDENILKVSKLHSLLGSKHLIIPKSEAFTFMNINDEDSFKLAKEMLAKTRDRDTIQ